jgi:hypothetical protein
MGILIEIPALGITAHHHGYGKITVTVGPQVDYRLKTPEPGIACMQLGTLAHLLYEHREAMGHLRFCRETMVIKGAQAEDSGDAVDEADAQHASEDWKAACAEVDQCEAALADWYTQHTY